MNTYSKIPAIIILLITSTLILTSCKKKPTLPVVTTTSVTAITQTTATSGGNVTGDGGAEVTSRGVCWNTSENPTTSNSKTSDGKGTGSFTSNLTSLTPGTKYYVRAYAKNEAGTGYGNQVSFTSGEIVLATVSTTSVTSITGTTAVSGGNITSDGGGQITARGVCWGPDANPTISNDKTNDGTGTGSFTSNITGLNPQTAYHVRAYATNSAGTAYGSDEPFSTVGGSPDAETYAASYVAVSTATLNGYVFANHSSTDVTFEYGTTESYGQTIAADPAIIPDGFASVIANVTGLNPGTTYHYRVKAINSIGESYGEDVTFTTNPTIVLTIEDATSWTPENHNLSIVPDATAKLYASQSSFENNLPDFTATSDANGTVEFNVPVQEQYFLVVEKADLSNIKDDYVIGGVFNDQSEIDSWPTQAGAQVGGLKYYDFNSDGLVNSMDQIGHDIIYVYENQTTTKTITIGN